LQRGISGQIDADEDGEEYDHMEGTPRHAEHGPFAAHFLGSVSVGTVDKLIHGHSPLLKAR
jgi:hypothetical protein